MLYRKGSKTREWGSTEAMGAIFLVTAAVAAIAVVGVFTLTESPPQKLPAFNAIISSTDDGKIVIYHDGGDVVGRDELSFMVNNVNKGSKFVKVVGTDVDSAWTTVSMGEKLVYDYKADGIDTVTSVDLISATSSASTAVASAQFAPDKENTDTTVAPVASFTGTPLTGNAPLNVSFSDLSTNTPTSWSWTFGDGTTSSAQNPSHTYAAAGNYTVTLTAVNSAGSNTVTKTAYVVVTAVPATPPVANFSGTPTTGLNPLTVTFTDLSTNTPTSWLWSFGDGSTSTEQNPSHMYTNTGTYSVTLTATNSGGSSTVTKTNYISVVVYLKGWQGNYYSDESWTNKVYTNNPSRLRFANVMAISNYSWLPTDVQDWPAPYLGRSEFFSADFTGYLRITCPGTYTFYLNSDDGSWLEINGNTVIDNGGLHSPKEKTGQVYLSNGYWPIKVKVYNHQEAAVLSLQYSSCSCGMSQTYVSDVWQTATATPPAPAFSGTPVSGTAPLTVQFTDASTGSPTSWSWSFGDGTTSTVQNPSHTYTTAGTYTVTMTATNAGGSNSLTKTNYITVTPASTQNPATWAYLVADNKCGYLGSGQYMQFKVNGYWSYINQESNTWSLSPGDVVRLTLNDDEKGEIYATNTYISTFNYEDVTVTINGVTKGTGRIHDIWISSYTDYTSTLTLNIPSKNKWTQLVVDYNTLIYGTDNQDITLYNLYATPTLGMNLDNHDCSDVYYSGGTSGYKLV